MVRPAIAIFAISLVASACSAPDAPLQACTDELRIRYQPADTTLVVGQEFRASITLSTCGGSVLLTDVFTWYSGNEGIVRVDSASGRVTAIAPGSTFIRAIGRTYRAVGSASVLVQQPPP